MARDLVTRAVADQLDQVRQTGAQFDPAAVRAAVAAEQRGDHLEPADLRQLADDQLAQRQQLLAASPTEAGGTNRIRDSIEAQYRALQLRQVADQRSTQ